MWITEDYRGQARLSLATREQLYEKQSEYQAIEIHDTFTYGKVLVLDGVFQTSILDEHTYHEMIAHPAMALAPSLDRVLIVGGGDGGTAREVTRYEGLKQIELVEIDEMVVNACRKHLPELGGGAWTDSRLKVHFEDAVQFIRQAEAQVYDVILVDGSDPIGPSEGLFGTSFFADCKRALKPRGLYVMQSGSPLLTPDVFYPTVESLASVFEEARPIFGNVSLYDSGQWTWTIAGERVRPDEARFERSAPFAEALRVYSPDVHGAAFVPPVEVARKLGRR